MKRKTKCGCDPMEWDVYTKPCRRFSPSRTYGPNGRELCMTCEHYRKCHPKKVQP